MNKLFKLALPLLFLCLSLALVNCAKMEESELVTLKIRPPSAESTQVALTKAAFEAAPFLPEDEFSAKGNFGLADPTTVAEIDCYGVFIEYPEIPPGGSCVDVNSNPVAFPNDMFGMFPSAQTEFEIQVLTGPNRIVSVLAFRETLGFCPFIKANFDTIEANLSHPILIGSSLVDISGSNTIVDVFSSVSSGTRLDDCTGPLFNQFDSNFLPTNLSGLIGWYDFGDASTVFQNPGCGSPATNGSLVRCVLDKSGNGNHALQPGGAAPRPQYVTNVINGRNAILFDGSDDHLDLGAGIQEQIRSTIFVVFDTTDGSAIQRTLIGADNSDACTMSLDASQAIFVEYELFNATGSTTGLNTGTPQLAIMRVDETSSLQVFVNNPNTPDGSTGLASPPFTPGRNLFIGAENLGTPSTPFPGKIAEVIIYNRPLTTSEMGSVKAYLKARWGIP